MGSTADLIAATGAGSPGARATALLALAEIDLGAAEPIALAWLADPKLDKEPKIGSRFPRDEQRSRTMMRPAAAEVLARSRSDAALDALVAAATATSNEVDPFLGLLPQSQVTFFVALESLAALQNSSTARRLVRALRPGLHATANKSLIDVLAERGELGDAAVLARVVEAPADFLGGGATEEPEASDALREAVFCAAVHARDGEGLDLAVKALLHEPFRSDALRIESLARSLDARVRPALEAILRDRRVVEGVRKEVRDAIERAPLGD
jgi:hypothetical protein